MYELYTGPTAASLSQKGLSAAPAGRRSKANDPVGKGRPDNAFNKGEREPQHHRGQYKSPGWVQLVAAMLPVHWQAFNLRIQRVYASNDNRRTTSQA